MRVLLCAIATFAWATLATAAQRPVSVPAPPASVKHLAEQCQPK